MNFLVLIEIAGFPRACHKYIIYIYIHTYIHTVFSRMLTADTISFRRGEAANTK